MPPAAPILQRFKRLPVVDTAAHLFKLGQAVRLKGGFVPTGNVYLITATLPPIGDSPQYHIRNEIEKFERMASQAHLELVDPSAAGVSATFSQSVAALTVASAPPDSALSKPKKARSAQDRLFAKPPVPAESPSAEAKPDASSDPVVLADSKTEGA